MIVEYAAFQALALVVFLGVMAAKFLSIKYNFSSSSDNIFLSVKRSDNQKSAVTDVPEIVGSIFGGGLLAILAVAGVGVGVGGTIGVQAVVKKKNKANSQAEVQE